MTDRDAVTNLYRGIFRREPDPGIEATVAALDRGDIDLAGVIEAFLNSDEFSATSAQLQSPPFMNEQSQFGEVQQLIRMMVNDGRERVVVDVGARGRERSNSYDLMKHFGWRGVLIEANPNLIAPITTEFEGLNMSLINCAASDYDGEATFHFGINDDVSSLNLDATRGWGETRGEVTVPVRRLPALLDTHAVPKNFDLLSIDIEGEDIKVLNDVVEHGFKARFVVIEACYDYSVNSLYDLPFSDKVRAAYEIVERTPANLILRAM